MVRHNHIEVNGKKVNIPSYQVKVGDVITIKEQSKGIQRFKDIFETASSRTAPQWMDVNFDQAQITVTALPARDQIDIPVEETLIVELYSK